MTIVTAIIPTRSGSTRLKDKNIVPFQGEPLLARKVRQLKACKSIDRVLVASDSLDYLEIARAAGADAMEHLPEHLTRNDSPFSDVVYHLADKAERGVIAWAPCTAPLIDARHYDPAINQFLSADWNDSLVMVAKEKRFFMTADAKPMNYTPGPAHQNSQDLTPMYVWSGGLWCASRADMMRWRYFHGPAPILFPIPKWVAVDIDDGWDYRQAEAWAQS